jgi:anti-sigma B factor antagonist
MYRFGETWESAVSVNPKAPTAELTLKIEKKAEETSVHCSGRITSASSDLLQKTIRALIPKTRYIVLDLSGVSYIDSSGLGAMVSLHLALSRAGGELKVSNAQPRITELFQITKLSAVFENHGYRRLGCE